MGPGLGLGHTGFLCYMCTCICWRYMIVMKAVAEHKAKLLLALPSCARCRARAWQFWGFCWRNKDGKPPRAEPMNATQAGGLILPLAWAAGDLPDGAEPPSTDSIIQVPSQNLEAQAVT